MIVVNGKLNKRLDDNQTKIYNYNVIFINITLYIDVIFTNRSITNLLLHAL